MIDIKLLRENPELVRESAQKGYTVDVDRSSKSIFCGERCNHKSSSCVQSATKCKPMKGGKPEPSLVEEGKN